MGGAVIMTCAFNYRAEQMKPFLHSLRLYFKEEDVVFRTSHLKFSIRLWPLTE